MPDLRLVDALLEPQSNGAAAEKAEREADAEALDCDLTVSLRARAPSGR